MTKELKDILLALRPCFQCGTCSGGCPVFLVDPEKNPRATIEKLLLGDLSLLDGIDVFYCSLCGTCYSRCPQQIDLPHLLIDLKNWVIKNKGTLPEYLKAEMDILLETGFTAKMSGMVAKRRAKLGLPELKEDPKTVKEVQKIMEATGFKALAEKANLGEEEGAA